jgi:hypothetical protein
MRIIASLQKHIYILLLITIKAVICYKKSKMCQEELSGSNHPLYDKRRVKSNKKYFINFLLFAEYFVFFVEKKTTNFVIYISA